MAFKDTVKTWFETGDFPTQAQFWQKFDWLRWKDEPLAIGDVTGLQQILNELSQPIEVFTTIGGTFTYTLAEFYLLEKIVIKPSSNSNAYCSSSGGLPGDIVPQDPDNLITAAAGTTWDVNQLAIGGDRDLLIEGLPSGSTLVFIKRKTTL